MARRRSDGEVLGAIAIGVIATFALLAFESGVVPWAVGGGTVTFVVLLITHNTLRFPYKRKSALNAGILVALITSALGVISWYKSLL